MIDPRIDQLEEEIELLRQQLGEVTGTSREIGALMSIGHGMTSRLATMLFILVKRAPAVVSRSAFHSVIYGDRSDGGPEPRIFALHVSRLRGVLLRARAEGKVETVWGAGYKASPALAKWVRELYSREIGD